MIKRTPITAEKALQRLENLCARSEQAEGEVREKLRRWGVSPIDSDKILQILKKGRYVDDKRFVKAFINDKVRFSHWGRRKIQQALIMKRIDLGLIDEALQQIDIYEYKANAYHVAKAKADADPTILATYEGRTKLFRHLLSRGYESEISSLTLKVLIAEAQQQGNADPSRSY